MEDPEIRVLTHITVLFRGLFSTDNTNIYLIIIMKAICHCCIFRVELFGPHRVGMFECHNA